MHQVGTDTPVEATPAGMQETVSEKRISTLVRSGWVSKVADGKPASSGGWQEGLWGPTGLIPSFTSFFCILLSFPQMEESLSAFAGVKFSCLDSISVYRACHTYSLETQRWLPETPFPPCNCIILLRGCSSFEKKKENLNISAGHCHFPE